MLSFNDVFLLKIFDKRPKDFNPYRYDVNLNYEERLEFLLNNGYIRPGTAGESLIKLKIPELKKILTNNSLPTSGNKAGLIERIKVNVPEEQIDGLAPKILIITDKGNEEIKLKRHFFINMEEGYNIGNDLISRQEQYISSVNDISQYPPEIISLQIIWSCFNEQIKLACNAKRYDHLRRIKFNQASFMYKLKHNYLAALSLYFEAWYYTLQNTSEVIDRKLLDVDIETQAMFMYGKYLFEPRDCVEKLKWDKEKAHSYYLEAAKSFIKLPIISGYGIDGTWEFLKSIIFGRGFNGKMTKYRKFYSGSENIIHINSHSANHKSNYSITAQYSTTNDHSTKDNSDSGLFGFLKKLF